MKLNVSFFSRSLATKLLSLFVLLILLSVTLQILPSWRLDLTDEKLYTLSAGSLTMLKKIDQPVELTFYFSDQATKELPQQRSYAQRVRELLNEYERAAPDILTINEQDPEAFSDAEDRAAEFGLQGIAASAGGDLVYFGLVGESVSVDGEATGNDIISFFTPEREAYLEYDISQLIYRLSLNTKPVVGLISSLPLLQSYQQPQQPGMGWLAVQQLEKSAEIKKLPHEVDIIDADIDLLLIVHPSKLSDTTLYAIDQYILSGAAAMIIVDPNAEMAAATPMAGPGPYPSDFSKLFMAWGVQYDPAMTVGDAHWGLRLPAGEGGIPLPHIGIIGVQKDSINRDDLITAELESVNLSSAGYFTMTNATDLVMTPLLSSSLQSQILPAKELIAEKDHSALLQGFVATGQSYTLMARLNGKGQSAFNETDITDAENHKTDGIINVIIGADSDMLSDRLWVQVSNFFGQSVASPWANNGDILVNAVDNMLGSPELISLRSRGVYSRPFVVIDELRAQAAERFRVQEQNLTEKLALLEENLAAFSTANSSEAGLTSELMPAQELSDEQQKKLEKFEQERLDIRKQLRHVQHQLNRDIDDLQLRLMLINFLAVPLLLILVAAMLWLYRRRYRSR